MKLFTLMVKNEDKEIISFNELDNCLILFFTNNIKYFLTIINKNDSIVYHFFLLI